VQDTAGARDAHTLGHGGCERRAHAPESGVEAMHDSEPARMHLQCALPAARQQLGSARLGGPRTVSDGLGGERSKPVVMGGQRSRPVVMAMA
jgi:hypothetical protein